jgi:hypothetical protein
LIIEGNRQPMLIELPPPATDAIYAAMKAEGIQQAQAIVFELQKLGPRRTDLVSETMRLVGLGRMTIVETLAPRERTVKDHHHLRL